MLTSDNWKEMAEFYPPDFKPGIRSERNLVPAVVDLNRRVVILEGQEISLADVPLLDATAHAADQIDSRIAGLTAGTATKKIFSTETHTETPSYVRSAECWAADIDLTGISPWNSSSGTTLSLIAISPDLALGCNHALLAADDSVSTRWIAADGTIVTRTLTATQRVGSTDIQLYKLSSALPPAIKPIPILPADYPLYLLASGLTALFTDQENKALILTAGFSGGLATYAAPSDAARLAFYETPITGDSGHPVIIFSEGQPILISAITNSSSGGLTGGSNLTAILGAVTSLGATAPATFTFRHLRAPVSSVSGRTGDITLTVDDLSDAGDDIKDFLRCEDLAAMKAFLGIT